ncbi:MAG: BTAD domain-containing putative transcriptional regulator [Alphaproteobacteria bacterium]|nr:BTAD domain-containing putative transcriptional regulator [Alphaproteobacteria bacterium]
MAALHISLFGGFEARLGSGEVLPLKGRKTQALVGYLALTPGKRHTRDELVALLWSDRGERQARSSLRQSLSELRKALGDGDDSPLIAGRDAVSLDADAVDVDVAEFEHLIDDGTPTALERAVELYRGDLLDGIGVHDPAFEDWLRDERGRLQERACEALSRLLDHQAVGDTERAIATARRLLALDPLRETTHRALMRLYAGKGERTLALKQYQACHDVLAAELGLSPETETEELAAEIRTGAARTEEAVDPVSDRRASRAEPLPLPDKPSIAVLPFVNISGDPEQEYFSDGVTEDIITELSRFRSLFVIAHNSSFTYKGRAAKVQDIGRELGVQYVVEGSVRKAGDRVRITAQFVEAESGNHLWAERYDRDLEDVFAVQDEVVQAIVSILPEKLGRAALAHASRKSTDNLTAYDYLLRGEWYTRTDYGDPKALEMFEKAVEIDPQCARAYARLAVLHLYNVFRWGVPSEESARKGLEYAELALGIDEDDASVQAIASLAYHLLGQHDRAKIHSENAIALNPNDVYVISRHAHLLAYLGDPAGGIEWMRKEQRLDPHEPESHAESWVEIYYMARQYEQAIAAFERWRNPPFHLYAELAACHAQAGRMDDARAAVAEYERQRPKDYDFGKFAAAHMTMCKYQEDRDHWLEGYRKAGFSV